MDAIIGAAKQQQQTQINVQTDSIKTKADTQQNNNQVQQSKHQDKMKNEKDVQELVKDLNSALSVINTTLKFGVDKNDVFYVSVIDQKTNRVIRRWPAEEAKSLLPKVKEFSGIFVDQKG